MFRNIKNLINKIENSRILFVLISIVLLFSILFMRVFYLQIIKGQEYINNHTKRLERTIPINGPRGNIYDRKGRIIAYNKQKKELIIDNKLILNSYNGSNYDKIINSSIIKTLEILKSNNQKIKLNSIPIFINEKKEFEYSVSDQVLLLGFLRDIFGKPSIDNLTVKEKNIKAPELIDEIAFKTRKNSNYKTLPHFNIDSSIDAETLIDVLNIRNEIYQNRYQEYKNIVISDSISDQTSIDLQENKAEIPGIRVIDSQERVYNDALYISNIVGYTGSNKEKPELIEGKMGIEKSYNDILSSSDGYKKIHVDSTGKILEEVESSKTKAGNDITLSIDLEFQKFIYNSIEDALTKYLLDKLVDANTFLNDIREVKDYFITSSTIYNSLLTNGVINLSSLYSKKATETEKKVKDIIEKHISTEFNNVEKVFKSQEIINNISKENKILIKYIFTFLQREGIIEANKLNSEDSTIKKWVNREINVKTYLSYLLGNGFINTEKLSVNKKYSDIEDVIDMLSEYIKERIFTNKDFLSLTSQKLFKNNLINPRDLIQILYDQEFLTKDDNYKKFEEGMGAYDYLRLLITNKKLTPGIIGVDPFSTSVVINDINTGKVLGMVSYPSYDSNKMNDSKYLRYVLSNNSSPLMNRPTQLMKPPGSTFKMLTLMAALNEKVISPSDGVLCEGEYKKVTPHPHCWIYPKGHGVMNAISGLANSCNVYFNDLGYRLGFIGKNHYNDGASINQLQKYGAMFGLDKKTGVEIEEVQPHLSDDNGILSAIGQGTNLFNTANLARYVSAIAKGGEVLNLSLVLSIKDSENKIIEPPKKIHSLLKISDDVLKTTRTAMNEVSHQGYVSKNFKDLGVEIGGKTGTAQEDLSKNDHKWFVSYAPYSNPEVATSIIIPNIQADDIHIKLSADILKYYFEKVKNDK